MQYNKERHLSLLKLGFKNKKPGKILSKLDFANEFKLPLGEQYSEYKNYSAMMENHLHWENRGHYFELIEKFLRSPLSFLDLSQKYKTIMNAQKMLESEFILLESHPASDGFENFIFDIISLSERYCPDSDLQFRESHEFSEKEIKNIVQEIFIEMKEKYPL